MSKTPATPEHVQAESKLLRHLLYTEFNEFAGGDIEAGQMNPASPPQGDFLTVSAAVDAVQLH